MPEQPHWLTHPPGQGRASHPLSSAPPGSVENTQVLRGPGSRRREQAIGQKASWSRRREQRSARPQCALQEQSSARRRGLEAVPVQGLGMVLFCL